MSDMSKKMIKVCKYQISYSFVTAFKKDNQLKDFFSGWI